MAYVQRDPSGNPIASFARQQPQLDPPAVDWMDDPVTLYVSPQDPVAAQLLAAFAALPVGVQALYTPVQQAVNTALLAGQLTTARAIIATTPAPTPELVTAQTTILALFDSLIPSS